LRRCVHLLNRRVRLLGRLLEGACHLLSRPLGHGHSLLRHIHRLLRGSGRLFCGGGCPPGLGKGLF
jgi:hypothetical protein